jgi:hypothetical protein
MSDVLPLTPMIQRPRSFTLIQINSQRERFIFRAPMVFSTSDAILDSQGLPPGVVVLSGPAKHISHAANALKAVNDSSGSSMHGGACPLGCGGVDANMATLSSCRSGGIIHVHC